MDTPRHHAQPDADVAREPERPLGDDTADSTVLRAEELRVRMVPEVTGRVRLRKRIVEEQRTITVTVQREELEVVEEDAAQAGREDADERERADLGEAATQAEYAQAAAVAGLSPDVAALPFLGEGDAPADPDHGELVLFEQRPVVTYEWVPVERVRVDRVRVTEEQTFSGQVRREVADIEQEGTPGARADGVGDVVADAPGEVRGGVPGGVDPREPGTR